MHLCKYWKVWVYENVSARYITGITYEQAIVDAGLEGVKLIDSITHEITEEEYQNWNNLVDRDTQTNDLSHEKLGYVKKLLLSEIETDVFANVLIYPTKTAREKDRANSTNVNPILSWFEFLFTKSKDYIFRLFHH